MNTTAQDYKIKCQKKGCRNHVNWKVSAPTWNKTGYDVLLIPIGFCTTCLNKTKSKATNMPIKTIGIIGSVIGITPLIFRFLFVFLFDPICFELQL